MLHNASGTFSAQNSLVYRVITISFDIADFIISDVYIDPTPASTHVTRCLFDLVTDFRTIINLGLRRHLAFPIEGGLGKLDPRQQDGQPRTICQTVKFDISVRIC